MSLARPRLLFAFRDGNEIIFFSSIQPQNPVKNSCLVATRYQRYFPKYFPCQVYPPLRGLVFLHTLGGMERVICNPVSGKSITITLPEVIARSSGRRGYFGYDPINKQFKVLCHTYGELETNDSQVLTLETGNLIWRRTMECKPHSKGYGEICINGVLYYKAHIDGSSRMIVCFDFSSEKFSFFKIHEDLVRGTLVNYKGKLGVLGKDKYQLMLWVLEEDAGLMLWVLEEDAGNHNWCKRISVELKTCDGIVNNLYVVGMTGAGEIVFSPNSRPNPFYIVYSNIERKAFTRVYIQGFEEFLERRSIFSHIFVDYVENFKLL